ncbi:hypothetical protein JXQ70_17095 [bacterium]|nr:hypothetical protein [bacterium]
MRWDIFFLLIVALFKPDQIRFDQHTDRTPDELFEVPDYRVILMVSIQYPVHPVILSKEQAVFLV